jgi:hypothetical protein
MPAANPMTRVPDDDFAENDRFATWPQSTAESLSRFYAENDAASRHANGATSIDHDFMSPRRTDND